METPSSSTRVTRSFNNTIPVSKGKNEELTRNGKQQQERSALNDITNDSSPIVGVAMETPSSGVVKKKNMMMMMTPGCGESLLRGQVKTLLQKVEQEAELSKIPLESRPFIHLQSPMALLAPTPANTPQLPNLSQDGGLGSLLIGLPVVEEQLNMSEMVSGSFDGTVITRSLLLDFAEKSKSTKEKTDDDIDNASVWSIQVNASTHEYDDCYEEEEDDGLVDELCEGLRKISMTEMFAGKHTRFVYNSDGEIEGEEECEEIGDNSTHVIRLKGLPTPKGKHTRFPLEEED